MSHVQEQIHTRQCVPRRLRGQRAGEQVCGAHEYHAPAVAILVLVLACARAPAAVRGERSCSASLSLCNVLPSLNKLR